MSAVVEVEFDELPIDEQKAVLWRAGDLSWKLHDNQLGVHRFYRRWCNQAPANDNGDGKYHRVFVFEGGRRYGKTFWSLLLSIEDSIQRPGSVRTFATAYQKDVADILLPLLEEIARDAPADVRPEYRGSSEGESAGIYFPRTGPAKGSRIKLFGLDMHPHSLRGRASDGVIISEAGFCKKLRRAIVSVLTPQMQGRPHARILLESSAPEDPATDFDEHFVPDAKLRGAYVSRTIDDNPMLTHEEREEFIREAGGRGSPDCDREYFNKRVRPATRVVVPEFDEALHVQRVPMPDFADCYVALDPGFRDLFAILWAYWDFDNARLVIQRDWAERNASATTIAAVIKQGEAELWSGVQRWNGKELKENPRLRVSDTDPRMLADLYREHGLRVSPVLKTTGAKTELKEAAVHSVRGAIGRGQVIIDPSCTKLIAHLNAARWNELRTDYERSEVFGHFDLLDALVYMWRSIDRNRNAQPPWQLGKSHDEVFVKPEARVRPLSTTARALDIVLGGRSDGPTKRAATWKPDRSARWKRRK